MRTDKYYSAGAEVAQRGGLEMYRYEIEGGRFILSETDIRNMVAAGKITPSEFSTLDIIEVTDGEAQELIVKNHNKIGVLTSSSEVVSDEQETNVETPQEEPVEEEAVEEEEKVETNKGRAKK